MDNKITKKRFGEFLSYEWLAIIAIIAGLIFVWNFIFGLASVKPTTGQDFRYFVDYDISIGDENGFLDTLHKQNALSYDILTVRGEKIDSRHDVLYARIETADADIIFTSNVKPAQSSQSYRSKTLIDSYGASDFDNLYKDACNYLAMFLRSDKTQEFLSLSAAGDYSTVHDYANLDGNKIDEYFLTRMRGDNRYRTKEQKEDGKLKERDRIKNLCNNVADLHALFAWDDQQTEDNKLFIKYTRYLQVKERAEKANDQNAIDQIQGWIDNEANKGKQNVRYMLNLGVLNGGSGKTDVAEYFKLTGSANAKDTVMLAFDFKLKQPDHHYEAIGVAVSLARQCSSILD